MKCLQLLCEVLFSRGVDGQSWRLCLELISLSSYGLKVSLQLINLLVELCLRRTELLEAGPVLLVVLLANVPLVTNGDFGCSELERCIKYCSYTSQRACHLLVQLVHAFFVFLDNVLRFLLGSFHALDLVLERLYLSRIDAVIL